MAGAPSCPLLPLIAPHVECFSWLLFLGSALGISPSLSQSLHSCFLKEFAPQINSLLSPSLLNYSFHQYTGCNSFHRKNKKILPWLLVNPTTPSCLISLPTSHQKPLNDLSMFIPMTSLKYCRPFIHSNQNFFPPRYWNCFCQGH